MSNITFIETSSFTKYVKNYLTDEQYRVAQIELQSNTEKGDLIQGSGGIRKLRVASKGKGKSGGARIIYYWLKSNLEIWMLTIYGKNETSSIPGHVLKKIIEELKNE